MLIEVGIVVRSRKGNPWLERLLASLQSVENGFTNIAVRIEEGEILTKIEKKIRLFRNSTAKYLCFLEDDTEVLLPGWLHSMVNVASVDPTIAIVGPQEVKALGVSEVALQQELRAECSEVLCLGGFCQLLHRELLDPGWDPRISRMDDLYLCLLARSRGYRVVLNKQAIVRHTKQPWAPDDLAPWQQGDRSRFGETDSYYQQTAHQAARIHETKLLVDQFGDMARAVLPRELLAVVEPDSLEVNMIYPSCTKCDLRLTPPAQYVMGENGPLCFECAQIPSR
jgi:hypothetical protein